MITNLQQLFLDNIDAAFDPPAAGAAALAAFVANCFKEALLPVDFFAICFVLAIMMVLLL
jgi:histone H3